MKPEQLRSTMHERLRTIFAEVCDSERGPRMNPLQRHEETCRRFFEELRDNAVEVTGAMARDSGAIRFVETRSPDPMLIGGLTYAYTGPKWEEIIANELETGK